MPYVLRNEQTAEIYTCSLINIYKIPYFGAKNWDYKDQAESQASEFLEAQQASDAAAWMIYEVEEHQLKLFNVKLKNDPTRRLFMDADGRSYTKG
jgi:hypothetical protein